MQKCLVSWSSGKDSAWTVHVLRRHADIDLAAVLTTVNEKYQRVAMHAVREARDQGIVGIAFGDLFLEDIRRYREEKLAGTGLTPIFPLFGADTTQLAREMIGAGLKARLTCVNPSVLDRKFAGRDFDASLLDELPASFDPCGERGEFHSFAYAGPMISTQNAQ